MTTEQPELAPPRFEGTIDLRDGRRLGIAEYGPADGRPILWFHGTPGSRRQIPPRARELADEIGIRLVAVERPGIGASTAHLHHSLARSTDDVVELTESLDIDQFGVVALSGGGPYALACAHELPSNVVAVCAIGPVAPPVGPEAVEGGVVGALLPLRELAALLHQPVGRVTWAVANLLRPAKEQAMDAFARFVPPGDQAVFERREMREMFFDDLLRGFRTQASAPIIDYALFARPWGFLVADIAVPTRIIHGDADNITPVSHAEHLHALIPDSELEIRPDESHLGGLDLSDEIFEFVLGHWSTQA